MISSPLCHVWNYSNRDSDYWWAHLDSWLSEKIFDAHLHVQEPEFRLRPMTPKKRRQYWVNEVLEPLGAEETSRCLRIVFPLRQVSALCFGFPDLDYDIEASNRRLAADCARLGWQSLVVIRPQDSAEQVAELFARPNVLGAKVYYSLIGRDDATRDKYLEASIFDFLPPHQLEVLDQNGAWITLHVPKADRLCHPQNIADIRRIRREYPNVILVIAHFGRCYTPELAEEAFALLSADEGLYFDNSAVFHPEVHRLALNYFGASRILYGSDNPVFFMRGRQQWTERSYINHTDYPFAYNVRREPPEIEAAYTLYMYEGLFALRQVTEMLKMNSNDVEAILSRNASELVSRANRCLALAESPPTISDADASHSKPLTREYHG